MPNRPVYVGLISGTSMDGVDAVAVDLSSAQPRLLATHVEAYPISLKASLRTLCLPGNNEIDRMGQLDREVGAIFAAACLKLLRKADMNPDAINAIGSHGQTIRHRPYLDHPFTLQIGDPNTIAELTGITTVADLRRRDMAAGGQGAPLVPALHRALFQHREDSRIVLNLGGIANITCLPADTNEAVTGYDTGPASTLLDRWIEQHQGVTFDDQGEWARSGRVIDDLLNELLADPYFRLPPPKSTGSEYFSLAWLRERLANRQPAAVDVQATLLELSAASIARAIIREGHAAGEILTCGGGVHNRYLLERLSVHLPEARLASTADYGVDPDWVEATTFAWLAKRTLDGLSGNLAAVTGARHEVILGGIYPASRRTR
ncbi:MAG: anhydro-N-acetylmuramic acid kinase [gamma proteobacterium symbiont of Ctena orbiculata]|nr:MAG: anhydro-N-acetylmuramic acid kinase [gamma proteobacterium symbiont of Ctena orbiculata]